MPIVGIYNTRVGDFRFTYECADSDCTTPTGDLKLVAYLGTGTTVAIPATALTFDVASIGSAAFSLATALRGNLVLPDSIKSIEDGAFYGAGFDGTLTLPSGLETIGASAFDGVNFIGELVIQNNVTRIAAQAFQGTDFTSLSLGSSVREIGQLAFHGVPFSGSLTIPNSVTTIGEAAFYRTQFNRTLSLGDNVETIGASAFDNGPAFTGTLRIPAKVTTIGSGAFLGGRFSTLTFANRDSTTTIGNDAFKDISTLRGHLTIPEGVTSIGNWAFAGTGFDGRLTLPDSLTSINEASFTNASFTSVVFGANLTSIGVEAFRNTPLAGALTIPSNVTSLGARAFELTRITSVSLPSGLTSIGESAFASTSTLRGELELPAGLTELRQAAFYGTSISGSLVIPSGITNIAASTFGATRVSHLTLSNETTSIGDEAFYRTAIETLTLPRTLESIGDRAFGWRFTTDPDSDALVILAGGTFTFEGNAPTISSSSFESDAGGPAEDMVIRYPEGAVGWPIDPSPFGLRAVQEAVAAPPLPNPEPSPTVPAPSPEAASSPAVAAPQQPVTSQPSMQTQGAAEFVIDGQVIPVRSESGPRGTGLTLQAGPVEFTLRSQTANGRRVPLAPDGSLILPRTGEVPISGDGLEPNSSVAVTLFSNPISLGSTPVGADGTFKTAPVVPASVPLGAHTLQLTGRTKTGDPFVLAIGVLVETPAAALGADPVISVRPAIITPGTSVAVTARGVQAGCRVSFTIAGKRATAKASTTGIAQAQITMPNRLPRTAVVRGTVSGPKCTSVSVSSRVPTRRGSTP